jgi:hypothetical protein
LFGALGLSSGTTPLLWPTYTPGPTTIVSPEPALKIVHGKPYTEILRLAEQESVDLIVMGVHGRGAVDLTKIKIPVLAINGEFDGPNAKTHRMKRELANFSAVVLPCKSHLTAIVSPLIVLTPVAQLAGQYAEQFTGSDNSSGTSAIGALEFTRRRDAERVRIVTEPVGYSVWLDCRD